jgi:hypothetical protein
MDEQVTTRNTTRKKRARFRISSGETFPSFPVHCT